MDESLQFGFAGTGSWGVIGGGKRSGSGASLWCVSRYGESLPVAPRAGSGVVTSPASWAGATSWPRRGGSVCLDGAPEPQRHAGTDERTVARTHGCLVAPVHAARSGAASGTIRCGVWEDVLKKTRVASERCEEKRAAFCSAIEALPVEKLVFLDECGFALNLHRLYGWATKGERCVEAVPFKRCPLTRAPTARCWAPTRCPVPTTPLVCGRCGRSWEPGTENASRRS